MKVLVSNVGSTSLKFKLYEMPQELLLCCARIENIGLKQSAYLFEYNLNDLENVREKHVPVDTYADGINMFIEDMCTTVISSPDEIDAIGFKTVISKGFNGTVLLTDEVMKGMKDYLFIAPVHNRAYIDAIEQFKNILLNTPMIGVFETSFHTTIPLKNKIYPIPYEWYEKYGIAKKGYHGASFTYISKQARNDGNYKYIIGCHLGGSSSICAIKDGKSYDSSFGFSLQTGLPHANRCGDADPYIVPFLEDQGMEWKEIEEGLSKKGGLYGISGVSNDLREIIQAAENGNEQAVLAIDVYVNDIVRYIGAFYAEMGGLEKIVFSGGIGEKSFIIRKKICDNLKHLGVELDYKLNEETVKNDGYISSPGSKIKVQVIKTNEELGIARETYRYVCENNA